jgi:hypothetical protein
MAVRRRRFAVVWQGTHPARDLASDGFINLARVIGGALSSAK